jgi:hypothetical protein
MLRTADSYGALVMELHGLVRELREARTTRDRNDAQDLWDAA